MKRTLLFSSIIILISCARPIEQEDGTDSPYANLPDLNWEKGIEIVTWNIEVFPKSGQITTDKVAMIIKALNADIFCLQEMSSESAFNRLAEQLEDYTAVFSTATRYSNLAILYKKDSFSVNKQSNVLSNHTYEFAYRPPLRLDMTFTDGQETDFTLINVHLKCCGSGFSRRKASAELLHQYLIELKEDGTSNQIVAGDWNDDISDSPSVNSFNMFIEDSNNFNFVTWDLANAASNINDSYPSYPSFIDHILISNGFFDEANLGEVQTLRLGDYITQYDATISDHRPVFFRFIPQ
jgi:endonuclease/exonuclease/phosphatase family metal-dependent hydrolase